MPLREGQGRGAHVEGHCPPARLRGLRRLQALIAHDQPAQPDPVEEAAHILGLLAEIDRLKVASAIALGSSTVEEIARQSGVEGRAVERALARLTGGGVVEHVEGLGFRVDLARLKTAARRAAQARPEETEFDASPEDAKVLRSFISGGRLRSIPVARNKRLVVLDHVVQSFEPGRRYPEAEVNAVLSRWHEDVASLRRYLVDEGFMTRTRGRYWRSGGTVPVD